MKLNELIWKLFGKHKWVYRNPYNRTCSVCDRNEVSCCDSMETWPNSWWEVFHHGEEHNHYE